MHCTVWFSFCTCSMFLTTLTLYIGKSMHALLWVPFFWFVDRGRFFSVYFCVLYQKLNYHELSVNYTFILLARIGASLFYSIKLLYGSQLSIRASPPVLFHLSLGVYIPMLITRWLQHFTLWTHMIATYCPNWTKLIPDKKKLLFLNQLYCATVA